MVAVARNSQSPWDCGFGSFSDWPPTGSIFDLNCANCLLRNKNSRPHEISDLSILTVRKNRNSRRLKSSFASYPPRLGAGGYFANKAPNDHSRHAACFHVRGTVKEARWDSNPDSAESVQIRTEFRVHTKSLGVHGIIGSAQKKAPLATRTVR